jgi:mannose-6-phosphate isomerase-like protein (cupin superfamily)
MKKVNTKVFCRQLKGRQKFLRLIGDSAKIKGLRCGLVTLRSKESIGEHVTKNKEEAIIIIKGSATIHFGKKNQLKARQNSFVFIPPETVHNVENSGSKILQYVYITAQIV